MNLSQYYTSNLPTWNYCKLYRGNVRPEGKQSASCNTINDGHGWLGRDSFCHTVLCYPHPQTKLMVTIFPQNLIAPQNPTTLEISLHGKGSTTMYVHVCEHTLHAYK